MRKTIIVMAVVLVLLSLTGCGNSQALQTSKSIDLSKLSDEEIISLNKSIQDEIVARNIEKSVTLIPGDYYVGTDIPAGSYTFYAKADPDNSISFYVYADEMQLADYYYRFSEYVYDEETWALTLNEGEVFSIEHGEITVTVSAGIQFH